MITEDKILYRIYKNDGIRHIEDNKIMDILVLEKLDNLGLPMDKLGTYLYKTIVMKTYEEIINNNIKNDKEAAESLLLKLNYKLSNFYYELSRNDLDMGVKPFHEYINIAFNNIDSKKIDTKFAKEVYGSTRPLSYGTMAFKLALYLDKKYRKQTSKNILVK